MNETPLISVITAVRNGAPYLRQLIESVMQQDYAHFEHIVIDDGSTDGGATVAILQEYPHLRWWSRENKGQYATQNEALSAAKGEIIGVISADDAYVAPGTFGSVVNYWRSHPECDLVYGKTLQMDRESRLLHYQVDITGKYPQCLLRSYLYIQHCSLFVSRDFVVSNAVWFDTSFKYAGDWDWIVRLFDSRPKVGYLAQPLSIVRVHPNQASRRATNQAVMQEHKVVCRTHGGSFPIHILLTKLLQYRAMTMIALAALKFQGIRGAAALGGDWLRRRV